MKFENFVTESFQNISINGVLYSLNTDEKKIYTKAKEAGKLMKNDLSEYDQRIANGLVTRGLLKRRKNPQHEIYFVTKGRRKAALQKPIEEVAPPDSGIEKWIEDNKERFQERYGKEYKKYLYGKAWNKFNGKKLNEGCHFDIDASVDYDLPNSTSFTLDFDEDDYDDCDVSDAVSSHINGWAEAPVYDWNYEITNQWKDNEDEDENDDTDKEDYWDGEDEEDIQQPQINESENDDLKPQFIKDMERLVTNVGDYWKNIYNRNEYEVSEIHYLVGSYGGYSIKQPVYVLRSLKNPNETPDEMVEYKLRRDYVPVEHEEWDGEDDEDLKESVEKFEYPDYVRDDMKEITKVGELWHNKYNHKEYKVVRIDTLEDSYTDDKNNIHKYSVPAYILEDVEDEEEFRMCCNEVLKRDYTRIPSGDDWDGGETEFDKEIDEVLKNAGVQLNENVNYDVHVYDISYDLPYDFNVSFSLDEEDTGNFESVLRDEITDYCGMRPYEYNYEIEREENDNDVHNEENEEVWDGEDEDEDDQINEVLKNAGVQLNETRVSSNKLSNYLKEVINGDEYFLNEWKENKGTEEGYDKALEDMTKEWAEDILGGQMFLLDRTYMDVTWARIDDLIINMDDIFQDWSAFIKEDSSSDKYITTPEWDGEDDDELNESMNMTTAPKYEVGDMIVHNEAARRFKGDSPDTFYIKELVHPEGATEPWYILCCIGENGNPIRETAAFAENVIDRYFDKLGIKYVTDVEWDGEDDEEEELDETSNALNAIRDYYTMDDNDFEWLCDYMPRTFGIMDRLSDNFGIHGEDNCKEYMVPYLEKNREKLNEYIELTKNDNYITSYLNLPSGKYFNYTRFLKYFDTDNLESPSDYWDGEEDLDEAVFGHHVTKYNIGDIFEPKEKVGDNGDYNPFSDIGDAFEIVDANEFRSFYDYVIKVLNSDSEDRWTIGEKQLDYYFDNIDEKAWDGEDNEEELMETKPARLKHHTLEPDAQFAHISAERNNPLYEPVKGETPKIGKYKRKKKQSQQAENNKKTEQLKKDIKDMGLSYIKTYGAWHENDKTTNEKSFIIPNISKEDAMKLGKKYGQYSIIFKPSGEDTGSMYVTLDNEDFGTEDMKFIFNKEDGLEDVDTNIPLTNFSGYSGLKKNGHGYSFKYKEPKKDED